MKTVLASALLAGSFALEAAQHHVFVGTYTGAKSKGIYRFTFNDETGELQPTGLAVETVNPSFLAIHPNGEVLYASNEIGNYEGKNGGSVSAFRVNRSTGQLTFLNAQFSGGGAPCHLSLDKKGTTLLVANYSGGNVASFPINPDGSLQQASSLIQHAGSSINPNRQKGPHAHSVNFDPANRFAFAADLGLDKILIYSFDAESSKLRPAEVVVSFSSPSEFELRTPAFVRVPPGGGPRHFAFHTSGKFAYSNLELTSSVIVFAYESRNGALYELQNISTLPEDWNGNNSTAEILVHPTGRFVYCSNRGNDSIAVFKVDEKNGQLSRVQNEPTGGKTPRNFNIDPSGRYLIAANQGSDSLVVFRIDPATGKLTATGTKVECPTPVCLKFLPK